MIKGVSMSRPPQRLFNSTEPERITPRIATTMLIHGLLPPEQADSFKPASLTIESIIRMLHNANQARNRNVSISHVRKLARDMEEKNWLWTGEPIHIDTDGFVRNGQHRLLAVILSGTTQDFNVVRNLEPRAQLVIDTGRPRSVANQMQMLGVHSATITTAMANILLRWRVGKVLSSDYTPSVLEVSGLIESEPDVRAALTAVYRVRQNLRRAPLSALGAVFVEAGHVDAEARDEFFESLVTGADLPPESPILVLRNTITRSLTHAVRFRRAGQLYQIVHTWNMWRKGEVIKLLRVPSTLTSDTFPKVN
jgi:hypothetical protein